MGNDSKLGSGSAGEMLACPFCGSCDHLFIAPDETGSGGQWISPIYAGCSQTTGCGVSVSEEYAEDAVAKWNTRATPHLERLRIMAKQRTSSQMDEDDQENADWQGAYDWFCRESRAIYAALTTPEKPS